MRILVPALLLGLGVVALITMGVLQGGIPEMQVHQVFAGQNPGKKLKVHGKIGRIDSEVRPLTFLIRDKDDTLAGEFMVEVDDVRPDLFKVDNDVAVEGYYDPATRTLKGTKIYTKCPSKYEAAEATGQGSPPQPAGPTPSSSMESTPEKSTPGY